MSLIDLFKVNKDNVLTPQGNTIYKKAVSLLGTDASPKDVAPDELGCAETVTTILNSLYKDVPIIISTASLYTFLKGSPNFAPVGTPMAGDVIISPTGMGGYNGIKNGHTGIMGDLDTIMSNSSYTGTFERNYTLASWDARWKSAGHYPVFFYRRIA